MSVMVSFKNYFEGYVHLKTTIEGYVESNPGPLLKNPIWLAWVAVADWQINYP